MTTPSPIKTSKAHGYLAPAVTVYGSVAKLTAGGTQGNNEPGGITPADPARKL